MYIMSRDLSKFVVEESVKNKCSYCEGFEGHDISTMAFFNPKPLSLVVIGRHQQFWTDSVMQMPRAYLGSSANSINQTNYKSDGVPNLLMAPPTFTKTGTTGNGRPEATAAKRLRQRATAASGRARGPRVLVGIFSTAFEPSYILRERIRSLFALRNDSRVCGFSDFRKLSPEERRKHGCELVYTFVMGVPGDVSNSTIGLPTEIAGNDDRPLLVNSTAPNATAESIYLNIRENMDLGKSQTWLNYASKAAEEYEIEYVAKCDEDSILNLPRYFQFTSDHLPPAPYNTGLFSGTTLNKARWKRQQYREYRDSDENPGFVGFLDKSKEKADRPQHESFFDKNFDKVHIYISGKITNRARPADIPLASCLF
jgi:hypothetical protein